jgi:hypothetical protein
MERLWVCLECAVGVFRSYEDIAVNGSAVCPECAEEMKLVRGSSNGLKEAFAFLPKTIRIL